MIEQDSISREGMSENHLLELCSNNKLKNFKGGIPYWSSEIYGFGKYIREYGYYPKNLPLPIFTDHSGPQTIDNFNHYEINTDAPVVMFHSPKSVKRWKELYKKKCYILYSPFVFYRKTSNIQKSTTASGTLAYPAHTIPELEEVSNIETYIDL